MTPRCTEPLAAVSQGNRHAVHGGHRVHERSHWILHVFFQQAGCFWFDTQIGTAAPKHAVDPRQDCHGMSLVMDGIEGSCNIETINGF